MMNRFFYLFAVILVIVFSCRKNNTNTDTSAKLNFSTDSIAFDTVFSRFDSNNAPLSSTRILKIYNPYNSSIYTDIRLLGGQASVYRINIDGIATDHISQYKIAPKDSFYLFVQVTPKITDISNPLFVEDSILFSTNGNDQKIHLVAWGQDAHYLRDSVLDYNAVWSDKSKPYVIWNSILVSPGKKLTINKGVKVCSHVGSHIYVQGTLEMLGSASEPVVLQGDRIERNLDDVPNQWWGVRFLPGAKDNLINYSVIKNAVVGVEIDSITVNTPTPNLAMSNTVIRTMSSSCISAYSAKATFTNCAFFDAGQLPVFLQYGGDYNFTYCTIANPHCINFQSNYQSFYAGNADYNSTDATGTIIKIIPSTLKCVLVNSVIYGQSSNDEEFAIYDGGRPANITLGINNCAIKTKTTSLNANGNLLNLEPKFKDMCKFNYQLDSLSPLMNKGFNLSGIVDIDILGKTRDTTPCIGAYERN